MDRTFSRKYKVKISISGEDSADTILEVTDSELKLLERIEADLDYARYVSFSVTILND